MIGQTFRNYSNLVALPHSVFALPFALAAFLMANFQNQLEEAPVTGKESPTLETFILVVLAIVSARTAALAFNRLVDRRIDQKNPRTSGRELPAGKLSTRSAFVLTFLSSALFFLFCSLLGFHCLVLAPAVLVLLLGYSYTKRFTRSSHLVLGLALAAAPGGAWWVLRPEVELLPLLLMGAVLFWVSGFDILYSGQDAKFDRENGMHSLPATLGIVKAFWIARFFHLVAFLFFLGVGTQLPFGMPYYMGVFVLGLLLLGQHMLVSEGRLDKIDHAFFTFNGFVSIGYFLLVVFCFS